MKAIPIIKEKLIQVHLDLLETVDTSSEEYQSVLKLYDNSEYRAKVTLTKKFVYRKYQEASVSNVKSIFDFDVSISFRKYQRGIYLIPYRDMSMANVLDFLDSDKRLDDFYYQSQTDRPEEITAREWGKRRRVWHSLLDKNFDIWDDVLTLPICSVDNYYQVEPSYQDIAKYLKEIV